MSLDISNHSYVVRQAKDGAFIARFSNLRVAARHVVQHSKDCVVISNDGVFNSYECHKLLNAKDEQPA